MIRRWLIRVCFMLPILLSVMGWGWSTTQHAWIEFHHTEGTVACTVSWGCIYLAGGRGHLAGSGSGGTTLNYTTNLTKFSILARPAYVDPVGLHFLFGFGYKLFTGPSTGLWAGVVVLFWFLTLLSSAVQFWVWRKTAQPQPNQAFPVEPAESKKPKEKANQV